MSGNPLSRDSSYRIYTLYILKKLKVLDGNTIEGFEQQQAREHFTGRLTEEILRDKLDGRRAEDITELDLCNCRLKDFEEMFNHRTFPHLIELNLSGNEFTTVKMLGFLPGLKILILQSNKI
jgi:Leucine-rich repeat (LRR) protein